MEFLIIYSPQQITALNYLAQHCKVQNDLIQSKPCNVKLLHLVPMNTMQWSYSTCKETGPTKHSTGTADSRHQNRPLHVQGNKTQDENIFQSTAVPNLWWTNSGASLKLRAQDRFTPPSTCNYSIFPVLTTVNCGLHTSHGNTWDTQVCISYNNIYYEIYSTVLPIYTAIMLSTARQVSQCFLRWDFNPVPTFCLIRWVPVNFFVWVLFVLSRYSHYTLQHLQGKQPHVAWAHISICILKINCITSTINCITSTINCITNTISNSTHWKTPHYTTNQCWQWIWSPLQCTFRCCCLLTSWHTAAWEIRIKGKGKVHPRTGHELPEVE